MAVLYLNSQSLFLVYDAFLNCNHINTQRSACGMLDLGCKVESKTLKELDILFCVYVFLILFSSMLFFFNLRSVMKKMNISLK